MRISRLLLYALITLAMALVGLYIYKFHNPKVLIPIRGEFIKVDGVKLYIASAGEGVPLLLLHGFPYHADTWAGLMRQPWPGRRLIALDFPGSGMSEKLLDHPMSPEGLALTVKLFLDRLGIEEIDVVGHDLGGGVAMILASAYPKLVRRVVLIAPDSSAGSAADQMGWWWRVPGMGEAWASIALGRGLIRRVVRQAWSQDSQGWMEDVERYYRPLETAGGRVSFLNLNRGRAGFNYTPYEERFQAKTLIIWGGADRVVRPGSGSILARRLQAELKLLPKAGHLPQEEAAETVGEWIREFAPPVPTAAKPTRE